MQANQMYTKISTLSNSEVNEMLKQHYARRQNEDAQMGYFSTGNEQGNEFRKETREYIDLFNEFELSEQVMEIRRHCKEMLRTLAPNLTERDFILMWNLMPSGYDEAKHLVPGLANVPQENVVKMVNFLNEKRSLTQRQLIQ